MDTLTRKGTEIYNKLAPTLVPHYPGQYVIINTDNSEYWIDKDMIKAVKEAKKKYPDKDFYIAEIGAVEGAVAEFK